MQQFLGRVLVAGATGRTGVWIVRSLHRHGVATRLFVRSTQKASELFGDDLPAEIAEGSAENPEDIRRAVTGIDAFICAIGSTAVTPETPPPSAIDRDAVILLGKLARNAGVRHFILISSIGVTKPDHPLNRYGRVLDMKLAGENAIRKMFTGNAASYTVIRPGGLLDGQPFRHRLLLDTGDRITGSIDRSDVAEIAVLSLWAPHARQKTFEVVREKEERQESLEGFFAQISQH